MSADDKNEETIRIKRGDREIEVTVPKDRPVNIEWTIDNEEDEPEPKKRRFWDWLFG